MDSKGKQSVRVVVLHNPELLERILQYTGCNKTLLSASLTVKAFSEPAFNILWYEVNSIWPLFRLLPAFERGANGKYLFTGPVCNDHLQRVLYYAKRIRFLNYNNVDERPYANTPRDLIISTIMRLDKLGAFVPLRKIHLSGPFLNTMLFPLTSPYLESIEIRTKQAQHESTEIVIASSLQSVAQSPLIRSLVIDGPISDVTLQVIPDFINLQRLVLRLHSRDIPAHILKRLASSMPSLRTLYLNILDSRSLSNDGPAFKRLEEPDSVFRLSFPSLKTLTVSGSTTHLEKLFHDLDAPLLTSVSLGLYQHTPDVGGHMQKLVERNQQLLKDKVHTLIIQAVVPSLTLVNSFEALREFIVISRFGTMTMPDIVVTFQHGGSWSSSLTRLHLVQSNPPNGLSTIALYFIADACPNLQSLDISIHHPTKPVAKTEERKPHALKNLVFYNLPGTWIESMALAIDFVSFLDYLFPSMAVPRYTGALSDRPGALTTREAWRGGVEGMWRMCQTSKNRKNATSLSA